MHLGKMQPCATARCMQLTSSSGTAGARAGRPTATEATSSTAIDADTDALLSEPVNYRRPWLVRNRRSALVAAAGLVLACAMYLGISATHTDPFNQCDRQCRDAYGFYDRSITGRRVGALGQGCACLHAGEPFGDEQPWRSKKPWNSSFWCDNFSTALVCAAEPMFSL